MTTGGVSAIVLAGGRSSRFGRDKLAEPIDGRTLLGHAIEAVRPFATEIIVVVAPGSTTIPTVPAAVIVVHDTVAFEGPLAGLLSGLGAAREPVALVVGGDMPSLIGAVLEAMLAELGAPGPSDGPDALDGTQAVILEHDGRPRPLPMAVRREPALAAADRLIGAGERRLRALAAALTAHVIAESTWRPMDPGGLTMRDVDTPADLA
jgi:molybdopterin-guanine dinucleotide biosynthesis protein A